jgi:hypothetical protein
VRAGEEHTDPLKTGRSGYDTYSTMAKASHLLLLAIVLGSRSLSAQAKAQPPSTSRGFDSFIMLVAPRDTITIKRQTMRLGARGSIEAKKVEMVRLKERINLAKKENREVDRLGLEAERKAAEREKGLLERREELRQAESELEASRAELAALTQKALQLELQLAIRRAGRSRTPIGGTGAASLDRVIGELEKQTLEAQRAQSAYAPVVSDREIKVIDSRLDLLDAQQKILGGD